MELNQNYYLQAPQAKTNYKYTSQGGSQSLENSFNSPAIRNSSDYNI
jgi:hypothetical protein